MRRRGIENQFWSQAARKADFDASSSSRCLSRQNQYDVTDVNMSAQSSYETDFPELTANPGATVTQTTAPDLKVSEPQRLTAEEVEKNATDSFVPPDEPCFQSASNVGRRWHSTRRPVYRHRNRSVPFKIMSYNVLADSLLYSHPDLYEDCPSWCLEWEYRKKNQMKEILHYDADILSLQEVQEEHYSDWFMPELGKAGYQGIYKKRTGEKVDGCAIFYKESKFTLHTQRFLNFKMEEVPVMDRDNVAILALLQPRYKNGGTSSSTALCVVNTHLLFNKKRGDIKLLQMASLFAEIDKLKKEFSKLNDEWNQSRGESRYVEKIPVLLCGDFNSTPFCPLYDFIVSGFLNYKGISKVALSGQIPPHHFVYRERDILKRNIVPREMCLTSLCKWEVKQVAPRQENTVDSTSSHMSGVFTSDDFGCSSTNWQGYNTSYATDLSKPTSYSLPQPRSFIPLEPGTSRNYRPPPVGCSTGEGRYLPSDHPMPQYNPSCTIIRHSLHFWSVYRHHFPNRVEEVTTYHEKEPSCTVDFIFASPGRDTMCSTCRQRHAVMELTGSLTLLGEEDISLMGGLPNPMLSSDHLALVASFTLHL